MLQDFCVNTYQILKFGNKDIKFINIKINVQLDHHKKCSNNCYYRAYQKAKRVSEYQKSKVCVMPWCITP